MNASRLLDMFTSSTEEATCTVAGGQSSGHLVRWSHEVKGQTSTSYPTSTNAARGFTSSMRKNPRLFFHQGSDMGCSMGEEV